MTAFRVFSGLWSTGRPRHRCLASARVRWPDAVRQAFAHALLGGFFLLSFLVVTPTPAAGRASCAGGQLPTVYWGGPAELSFPPYGASSVAIEHNIKRGVDLAFSRANALGSRLGVLVCRNLSTAYVDDQADAAVSLNITEQLLALSEEEFFGFMVGPDATNSLFTLAYLRSNASLPEVPFVGPWAGSSAYVTPFTRWVFNTAPTNFASSIYTISDFFTRGLLVSRVALLYPAPYLVSGLDVAALTSEALDKLGLKMVASYELQDFNPDVDLITRVVTEWSPARPQAVILVGTSYQSATLIMAGKGGLLGPQTVYLLNGIVGPDIGSILTTAEQRAYVYSVDPIPALNDRTTPLATEFWADLAVHDPGWPANLTLNYGAFLGYLSGRWVTSVLEGMREPLTRSAFIDAAYATPIRTIGGITVGPFYDDCSQTSACRGCCNVGSRTMYVSQLLDNATTEAVAQADAHSKPLYAYEFAPVTTLTWSGCLAGVDDVSSVVKLGQLSSLTGAAAAAGQTVRLGLAYALEGSASIIALSVDDQSLPASNATLTAISELALIDNAVAMTAIYPEALIESVIAANASMELGLSLIGPMSASAVLFRQGGRPVRAILPLVAPTYVEIAAVMERYVTQDGLRRIGLLYDPQSPSGQDTLATLQRALKATANIQLALWLGYDQVSPATMATASSSVDMLLLHDPQPQGVSSVLASVVDLPCVVLSAMDPDAIVNEVVSSLGVSSLASLSFTQSLPNPHPPSSSANNASYADLIEQYHTDIANSKVIAPGSNSSVPSYLSIHAYLVGAFIKLVVSRINGVVTQALLIDTIYNLASFNVSGFVLGPFIDSPSLPGRNFGSGQVEIVRAASSNSTSVRARNSAAAGGVQWATEYVFYCDSASCTYDFATAGAGSTNTSGLSAWVVVLIVLACVAVTVAIVAGIAVAVALLLARVRRERNEWEIDCTEIDMGTLLGQGGFGEVRKAMWRGTEVAIKRLPEGGEREGFNSFLNEVGTMCHLRHPNVVLFMGACIDRRHPSIVMEYMALGSLFDLIHNDLVPALPLELKVKILYQAAKGMHFLHSSGMAHRDLKSLNLLLDAKWNVKVADFGLSGLKDSMRSKGALMGSVAWMAPEVLSQEEEIEFTLADVYSFGIVMWELLTREKPFADMLPQRVAVGVIRDGLRPALPDVDSSEAPRDVDEQGRYIYVGLICDCWNQDPSLRPTFDLIMHRLDDLGRHRPGSSSSSSTSSMRSGMMLPPRKHHLHSGSSSSSSSSPYASESAVVAHAPGRVGHSEEGTSSSSLEDRSWNTHVEHALGLPRKNVSFAVCDLASMNVAWQQDASRAERVIESCCSLVRDAAAHQHGRLFSMPVLHSGGTFYVAFASASEAALFALHLLAQMTAYRAGGDDHLREIGRLLRVGLHHSPGVNMHPLGDHMRTGYEVSAYTEACRLADLCSPGNALCSDSFRGACTASHLTFATVPDHACSRLVPPAGHQHHEQKQQDREYDGSDDDEDDVECDGLATGEAKQCGLCSSNACPWIIDQSKVHIESPLGQGSYGQVWSGSYAGSRVAIKRMLAARPDDRLMLRTRKEAAILSALDHPHVVKLIGLSLGQGELMLVMELMEGGTLLGALSKRRFPMARRVRMLYEAALGISFIHSHGIVHRDLKCSNLLLDERLTVKVADFGFATVKQNNATMTRCGSPAWTAPELFTGESCDKSIDVYSFGVLMWEVITGGRQQPYGDLPMHEILSEVAAGKRPAIPSDCPARLKDLMARCWHPKPKKRPPIDDVVIALNAHIDGVDL